MQCCHTNYVTFHWVCDRFSNKNWQQSICNICDILLFFILYVISYFIWCFVTKQPWNSIASMSCTCPIIVCFATQIVWHFTKFITKFQMKINNNLYLVFWDILFLFVVYVRVVNVCLWKDILGTPVNLQGILGKCLFEGLFRFMDQFDQTWTMWRAMGRWVTTIVKDNCQLCGKMQEEVSFLFLWGDDGHWGTNWHLKKPSRLEGH